MSLQSLQPQVTPSMPVSCHDRLNGSRTETDVIEVSRDFLAQFSPYEIALLPETCRPPRLKDANDVSEYAFALVLHHCDHAGAPDYAVHRLVGFFSNATVRLSMILHLQAAGNDALGRESA